MPINILSSRIASFVAASLVFIVMVALAAVILVTRSQAILEWKSHLSNLSLVLAEQTSQEVNSAVLVLDSMAESVLANKVISAEDLREKMGTVTHFNSMRDKTRGLPQVDVATIVASNGDVINFTRSYPTPPINLSQRDYFQAHLKNPKLGLFISMPVRNKGNNMWTFYLSRRLNGPNGEFIGLALVGFSSSFLSDFYKKIDLGSEATVALYRRDFTLLARWPNIDEFMGKTNVSGASFQVIEKMRKENDVIQTDSARLFQGGEHVSRLGAVRLISNYPLIINITVNDSLYLKQWQRFSISLSLIAGFTALAMVVAFMVLIRSLKRREQDMEITRNLKTAAESANRAKSEFLAMMSHEIRTPLTAIIGFAEILSKPQSVDVNYNAGTVILRNGNHLLGIINDILDMSKIEAGRLDIEKIEFSPIDLIQGVQVMMQEYATSKGIVFDIEVDYPFPDQVVADTTRWKQILLNLCGNAIKFTDRGSVKLGLSYDKEAGNLICKVTDTGIGISDIERGRLFQRFSQADSTVARKYGGTGLGLHLVKQLAIKMGGNVMVDSELGVGSVFSVAINAPLAKYGIWLSEEPTRIEFKSQSSSISVPLRGNVLLVDDGPDNRLLIGAFLSGIKVSFETAENGAQAVEMALAGNFDLILMDMQMPIMDGVTATAVLRSAGFAKPIIALTANVMSEDIQRYLQAGCTDCSGKPINFGELGKLLAGLLEQYDQAADSVNQFDGIDGYEEILHAFEASLPGQLQQLSEYIEARKWSDVVDLAHQLKGTGGSFGYPGVTLCAGEIEGAGKKLDGQLVSDAFMRLMNLEELKQFNNKKE
jgi:signal transduction histidine kinase/CheY-like chemotaxis protein